MPELPLPSLIRAAVLMVQALTPGELPDEIEVVLRTGKRGIVLRRVITAAETLPAPPGPGEHTPPPAPRFNDMEQDVLDAIAEAGGAELTGEQIAERAGYPFESPLRRCLASLRRRGVLTGEAGERGYRLASPPGPSV